MPFQQEPASAVVPPPTGVDEIPWGPPAPVVHVDVLLEIGAGTDGLITGAGAIGLSVKVGAAGLIVGTTGGGLVPAPASSVEPKGIPTAPPGDVEPIALGDEADAAGLPDELPLAVQPLDVPPVPPPSNTELEPDMPVVEPVLESMLEPVVSHVLPSTGDTPDVVGLTPGDASSVAPRGIPTGPTLAPGPMPSGDVMPSGDPVA